MRALRPAPEGARSHEGDRRNQAHSSGSEVVTVVAGKTAMTTKLKQVFRIGMMAAIAYGIIYRFPC